jgi:hypothetical protein
MQKENLVSLNMHLYRNGYLLFRKRVVPKDQEEEYLKAERLFNITNTSEKMC